MSFRELVFGDESGSRKSGRRPCVFSTSCLLSATPQSRSAHCSVWGLSGGPASLVHQPSFYSSLVHLSTLPVPGISQLSQGYPKSQKQAYPLSYLVVTLKLWYAVYTKMSFVVVVNFQGKELCFRAGELQPGSQCREGKEKPPRGRILHKTGKSSLIVKALWCGISEILSNTSQ